MSAFEVIDLIQKKPLPHTVEVPQDLLSLKPRVALLHEVVRAYEANRRLGTHSTLTRSEVRGGGRKPWKQKHTGRARAGSIRSPLWRKGGIVFGPKPRDYTIVVSQRKRAQALKQVLAHRLTHQHVRFFQEDSITGISKTKEAVTILKNLDAMSSRTLLVFSLSQPQVLRAFRNLKAVCLVGVDGLNALELLWAKNILFSDKAWARYLETRYHG